MRRNVDYVGRETANQAPAEELWEGGRGRPAGAQPITDDTRQLRTCSYPNSGLGWKESSSYNQRLESLCEHE